jgi:hypothetical protein
MGPDIRGPDSDFCRVVRSRRGGFRRRIDGLVVGGEGLDVRSIGQKMLGQKMLGQKNFFVRWWIRTAVNSHRTLIVRPSNELNE